MVICHTSQQLKKELADFATDCKIGFIPTMGALHSGHISLVKKGVEMSDKVVVSIFVNPTQFNNLADLERYPRTVEEDCLKLGEAGAHIVFIPSVEDIYPQEDKRIFDLGGLDRVAEGAMRPGHFNGVAQVVTRLFDLVQPKLAFFGEKDFQQLAIIRYITKELNCPIEIVACPTVRESDGVAMSSRNLLLTKEQRESAPHIYKTLKRAVELFEAQNLPHNSIITPLTPELLCKWVFKEIDSESLLKTEYVELLNSLTLQPVKEWDEADEIQMCVAVFSGEVRLIDNIKVK